MTKETDTEDKLKNWLMYQEKKGYTYCFDFFQITENEMPADDIIHLLQESILFSYRSKEYYNYHFEMSATAEKIRQYVKEQVIPSDETLLHRNVRQGDWGEILAALIATYFQNRNVPINKLQWKFNKDKSVFGTDLIAFNKGDKIKSIYYYETKTKINPSKKISKNGDNQYISVWAYRALENDAQIPTEAIADFFERFYFEKGDLDMANKFKDIIINQNNYNKIYEVVLIVENSKFNTIILDALNALPPILSNLNVTVILIDNLKNLVEKTWQDIENVLIHSILGNTE